MRILKRPLFFGGECRGIAIASSKQGFTTKFFRCRLKKIPTSHSSQDYSKIYVAGAHYFLQSQFF
jgi:hypothetical protein